ncbi:hypothetical protein RCL1_004889 [Eukaryota sp. TZLM3-RCL]
MSFPLTGQNSVHYHSESVPNCDVQTTTSLFPDDGNFITRMHLFSMRLANSPVCPHLLHYFSLLSCGDFDEAANLFDSIQSYIDESLYAELVVLMTPSLCNTALVTSSVNDLLPPDSGDRSPLFSSSSSTSPISFSPLTISNTPLGSPAVTRHSSTSSLFKDTVDEPSFRDYMPPVNRVLRSSVNRKITTHWSPEEDTKLIEAVEKAHRSGWTGWKEVAKEVGNNRTADSCSQRWNRCLAPDIKKGVWSADEDKQLRRLVDQFGLKNWKRVSQNIAGRTDIQCRYRWQRICSKS